MIIDTFKTRIIFITAPIISLILQTKKNFARTGMQYAGLGAVNAFDVIVKEAILYPIKMAV